MKRYQTIEREISFGKHAHATITLDAEGLIRATFYRYEGGQCFRQAETFDMENVWNELMDFYKKSEYLMNGMLRRLSVAWDEMKEEQVQQMDYLHQQANEENAFFDIENTEEKTYLVDLQDMESAPLETDLEAGKETLRNLWENDDDIDLETFESIDDMDLKQVINALEGSDMSIMNEKEIYELKATLYAEKFGIIDYTTKGSVMKYTDTYTGYKWEKNLITGENVLVSSEKGGNQ
jgi:hypothetical protein